MGMFTRKSSTCQERITAIDGRIQEFAKKRASQVKAIEDKTAEVGEILTSLALRDSEEGEQRLQRAKKVLSMAEDALKDLNTQLGALNAERKRMEADLDAALLKELPDNLEKVTGELNSLLKQAVGHIPALRELHAKMYEKQEELMKLHKDHRDLRGRTGMDVERQVAGPGELSEVMTPWSKYPPAEPEALGLLAPQRGLTAILTTKTPMQDMYSLNYKSLHDSLANFAN